MQSQLQLRITPNNNTYGIARAAITTTIAKRHNADSTLQADSAKTRQQSTHCDFADGFRENTQAPLQPPMWPFQPPQDFIGKKFSVLDFSKESLIQLCVLQNPTAPSNLSFSKDPLRSPKAT